MLNNLDAAGCADNLLVLVEGRMTAREIIDTIEVVEVIHCLEATVLVEGVVTTMSTLSQELFETGEGLGR